jgi:anti-anti-sigma factor
MESKMEITFKPSRGRGERKTRSVAIAGPMTIYAAAAAKDRLLDALDGVAEVEVDLSGVSEMDTAGAQLLVLLKREAMSAGKCLRLSGQGAPVMDVIEGYRLADYFADAVAVNGGKR